MGAIPTSPPVPTRAPGIVDAARRALTDPPPEPDPRRARVLDVTAILWCRDLRPPTVRQIGAAMGHTSPSTPLNGFGHLVDIVAGVIRREWGQIEHGWLPAPVDDRSDWLVDHVRSLLALDPACLRLPALVGSAVAAADPARSVPLAAQLAPLHALAAFAPGPDAVGDPGGVVPLRPPGGREQDRHLAVPA